MRVNNFDSDLSIRFSLKSPITIDGICDRESWLSRGIRKLIHVPMGTLGELYIRVSRRWPGLGSNRVVDIPSMPVHMKILVSDGCMHWGTLIMVPPLLLVTTPEYLVICVDCWGWLWAREPCFTETNYIGTFKTVVLFYIR